MKLVIFAIFLSTVLVFFFFNDTATTEIYTLSLHDALPISGQPVQARGSGSLCRARGHAAARSGPEATNPLSRAAACRGGARSEEHTSELQSQSNLVCRLLLEKKTNTQLRLLVIGYLTQTEV